jgi:imidazole glycerol phosphate synthase glutamine amidotransferase subunit
MSSKPVAVIIDYDAGNLRSVQRACHEVGLAAEISGDPERVRAAERIIFPGVGAAGSAMRSLRARGMDEALTEAIRTGTPVLGICLGLQISLAHSAENDTVTLGILPGEVRRFASIAGAEDSPHGLERGAGGEAAPAAAGRGARATSSTSCTATIPTRIVARTSTR